MHKIKLVNGKWRIYMGNTWVAQARSYNQIKRLERDITRDIAYFKIHGKWRKKP